MLCRPTSILDNVITITVKDPARIVLSIDGNAYEIITTYQITFANVTFVTTSDRSSSINLVVRV